MSKVTISDIARELDITPSTVSRALSDSPLVNKMTKVAIVNKAKEMGYERNLMASGLRKGFVKTVGIIVPRIDRLFFSKVIGAAEAVLNEAGYTVLICQTLENFKKEIQSVNTLLSNQVAGILISHSTGSRNSDHLFKALSHNVRVVQFDRVFEEVPDTKVVNDNFQGAYTATKHLIDQGYKRIGTLAGYMSTASYQDRLNGYKSALRDAGMDVDESIIFKNTIVRSTGYRQGMKALERGCDALYSAGDFSALGAIEAAMDKGLSIPREFGIVGTANEDFTSLMTPSLSSLELRAMNMGTKAAEAFLDSSPEIKNKVITLKMEFKIRESSKRILS